MQFFFVGFLFLSGLFGSQLISFDKTLEGMPKEKPATTLVKTLKNGDKSVRYVYKSNQTCVVIYKKSALFCMKAEVNHKKLPVVNREVPSASNPSIYTFGYVDGLECETTATTVTCAFPEKTP